MDSIFNFICLNAPNAYWILFLLLLLAGLNVPVSEDLILLTGGALASTCLSTTAEVWHLYVWLYLGCWLSAWEAYWLGRLLGPKLYDIKWFNRFITPQRIATLHHYYEKFGIFTFIVGRFFPGGIRNALFITSGLGKMPFQKFILRDGLACLISSSSLFYLGYIFGQNHELLIHYFKRYELIVATLFILIISTLIALYYKRSQREP
jgi:membrane-associated protein